jgi:alpha-glucosidase (family GH31 glycosyl hydrolase)
MVNGDFLILFEHLLLNVLSGVHPFHINLELNNSAQTNVHGQFLLNSNTMDVDLQPLPALTYTTIGGIIDLYIFTGPTVQNVIEQYWEIIGVNI